MTTRTHHAMLLVVVLLGSTRVTLAQPDSSFHANSELVVTYTTVLDKEYRFVKNLHASDFQLRVDRKETAIEAFWKEDEPVSAVIVLDLSGSMKPALRPQSMLLRSLLQNALPMDEYAILLCEDPIELAVPFSSDAAAILQRAGPLVAHGRTPLFDSVSKAVTLARDGVQSRKVVIVITDGEDTSSRLKLRELNRTLAEADVHLYVVQLWDGSTSKDRFGLQTAAEDTGGAFFADVTRRHLVEVLERLDIHERYVIAFRPEARVHDHKFHRISIGVTNAVVPGARLYFRRGFYDP